MLIGSGIGGVEFFEDNCAKFNKAGGGAAGLKKVCSVHSTNALLYTSRQRRPELSGDCASSRTQA